MVELHAAMLKWKTTLYAAVTLVLSLTAGPVRLHAHGAYHDLMLSLTAEMEKRPDDPDLYRRRARVQVDHEDWQAALVDLEKADRLDQKAVESDLLRGRALLLGHQPQAALQCLRQAVQGFPELATPRMYEARALAALGQSAEAYEVFRQAVERLVQVEPDHVFEMAALARQAEGPQAALTVLNEGLDKLGHLPALTDEALKIEIELKRHDAAVVRVTQMLTRTKTPLPWLAKRAELLTLAGRVPEAEEDWQQVVSQVLALPTLQRGSHAMCRLLERAQVALGKSPLPRPVVAAPVSASPSSVTSSSAFSPPSSPQ